MAASFLRARKGAPTGYRITVHTQTTGSSPLPQKNKPTIRVIRVIRSFFLLRPHQANIAPMVIKAAISANAPYSGILSLAINT